MKINIHEDKPTSGKAAAELAAQVLRSTILKKGRAVFIVATGASQFDFLSQLVTQTDIDWKKTTMFHLDEYVGLSDQHPASFRKYLRERFTSLVQPGEAVWVNGDAKDLEGERKRLSERIAREQVDVCFCGIGENGHLAFNDPPADFETIEPYLTVELDEACRQQQMGEGWFKTIDEVPKKALSMGIRQIMKSKIVICTVPDTRKAKAVKDCLEGPVSNLHPASILQNHPDCHFFLDKNAASLLTKK